MIFKICGLKEKDSILCCEANNVDFFGLIFYKKSPRNISYKNARELINFATDLRINPVGVFVNQEINDLNKLKEQGIISDEEFKKAKEKD